MTGRPLSRRFYSRPAETVARALLGRVVVCGDRAGRIVETEAYVGPHDTAAHSRFGVTKRNAVMWDRAGHAYVYFIYGMHEMFNVVTGAVGVGQAVLVRALEPAWGLPDDPSIARGPGKLTRALGIHRAAHAGVDLTELGPLFIDRGRPVADAKVRRGPRVGIAYASDEWRTAKLRFWIGDSKSVSRHR